MNTARVKNAMSAIPAISAQTSQDSAATLVPPLFVARAEPRDREADRHPDRDGSEQTQIQGQSRGDQCNAARRQGAPRHRAIEQERYQQRDQCEGARKLEGPFRGNHRAGKEAVPANTSTLIATACTFVRPALTIATPATIPQGTMPTRSPAEARAPSRSAEISAAPGSLSTTYFFRFL